MNDGDADHRMLITRAGVARRQLNAAIRMFFRGDDELAVHTVAQGAFQIIRDLLGKQKKDVMEVAMSRGLFEALKAHANGQLPTSVAESLQKLIAQAPPDFLEAVRDRSFEDMEVTLRGFDRKAFWISYKQQYIC